MPAYLSNISDATLNTQIAIGTTVTFFSFYNFSISSRRNWYFSIFSNLRSGVFFFFFFFFASLLLSFFGSRGKNRKQITEIRGEGMIAGYIFSSSSSFTRVSPGIATFMILASFAYLSTKMMSGLLASAILSHCTLKSHTTCSGVCLCHWSARSSSAFPHSCQCTYRTTLSCRLLYSRWANLQHSLVRWLTLSLILRFCQCKTCYSWFLKLVLVRCRSKLLYIPRGPHSATTAMFSPNPLPSCPCHITSAFVFLSICFPSSLFSLFLYSLVDPLPYPLSLFLVHLLSWATAPRNSLNTNLNYFLPTDISFTANESFSPFLHW